MTPTRLMGIVNITPDSFSDGGAHLSPEAAFSAIEQMIAAEVHVIDIGAESTRPGATPLSHEEEWARLEPVLSQLSRFKRVEFSLDTRHPGTARKGLACGVHWINDVSGLTSPEMINAVKDSSCKLVLMHSLTVPADKNVTLPEDADAVVEVLAFGQKRIAELEKAGIARERIVFDVGLGFGKNPLQSMMLLRDITQFRALGVRLLVGHSRKAFLIGIAADRDEATLAVSQYLCTKKIDYIRVHDVAAHRDMLNVLEALGG